MDVSLEEKTHTSWLHFQITCYTFASRYCICGISALDSTYTTHNYVPMQYYHYTTNAYWILMLSTS